MVWIRWHRPGFVNDGEFEPGEVKEVEANVGVLKKLVAAKLKMPIENVNLSVSRRNPEDNLLMLTWTEGQSFVLGYLDAGDIPELPEWKPELVAPSEAVRQERLAARARRWKG